MEGFVRLMSFTFQNHKWLSTFPVTAISIRAVRARPRPILEENAGVHGADHGGEQLHSLLSPASRAAAVLPGLVVIVIPVGRHISIIVVAGIVIIHAAIAILVIVLSRKGVVAYPGSLFLRVGDPKNGTRPSRECRGGFYRGKCKTVLLTCRSRHHRFHGFLLEGFHLCPRRENYRHHDYRRRYRRCLCRCRHPGHHRRPASRERRLRTGSPVPVASSPWVSMRLPKALPSVQGLKRLG